MTSSEENAKAKIKQIPNMFTNLDIPTLFQIDSNPIKIDGKVVPEDSINIDYPKFTIGFQHFYHAKKEQIELFKQFDGKKKVYKVVNRYNIKIDEYPTDIEKVAKVYFDTNPKPAIASESFYGFWEMLMTLDIIPTSGKFSSLHMMETGSYVQAVLLYRDKFSKDSKNDKYVIYDDIDDTKHKDKVDEKLFSFYKKEKPQRIAMSKPAKSDLVVINLGSNWEYRNLKEQDSMHLLCRQLSVALSNINEKGTLVCDIFETFTETVNKILCCVLSLFDSMIIHKPLTVDPILDNRYVVFRNYKGKQSKVVDLLNSISQALNTNPGKFIVSILPDMELPKEYITIMRKANTDISNRQMINLNQAVDFINKENYYGDTYQNYRGNQIKYTNLWLEKFFPDKKTVPQSKDKLRSEFLETVSTNKTRANLVENRLE